jgi:hypothetical protein
MQLINLVLGVQRQLCTRQEPSDLVKIWEYVVGLSDHYFLTNDPIPWRCVGHAVA